MKRYLIFPLLALAGGGGGLVLRALQQRSGFEPGAGLAVPGDPFGLSLLVLLAAVTILCALLLHWLPRESGTHPPFPGAFAVADVAPLTVTVAGIFLLAVSGLLDLASGFLPGPLLISADGMAHVPAYDDLFTQKEHYLLGVLSLLSAVCLFPMVPSLRRRTADGGETPETKPFNVNLPLVPVVCLTVRLVLVYRVDSTDPVLAAYVVELLALTCTVLALYYFAGFGFKAGLTRSFTLLTVAAAALSFTAVADGRGLTQAVFYGGCGLLLLGLLCQRMLVLARPWDAV